MGTGSTIGSVGGGIAGGVAGSSFGPIGTIAGGYLGSMAGGMIGGMFDGGGGGAGNDDPQGYQFQAPQLDQSQTLQDRDQQKQLNQQLQMRAMGTGGPSVADKQLQQGLAQTQLASQNAAANVRGGSANQFAAYQNAQQTNATLGGQVNQQAAAMRAQEQIAAQQQYAQQLAGMRGQDFGEAAQQQNVQLGADNINAGLINNARSANATRYGADKQASGQMFGGLMGAGGSIGASYLAHGSGGGAGAAGAGG